MNPLGGGVIPDNAERFSFLRGEADADVVTAAIRFNVSQPAITTALVGFSTTQQVDQAVAAVESFRPYDAAHIERVKRRVEQDFGSLCTGCGYCLPCPQGVEIPKLMDTYNHRILQGTDQAMRDRLQLHWSLPASNAAECTQCGQCETKCTQHLPIIERMAAIAKLK
jgi:hypothetical protein